MKFYYEGKLIRTSKNHHYTHAAFEGDNLLGCSSTFKGAMNAMQSRLDYLTRSIEEYENIDNPDWKRRSKYTRSGWWTQADVMKQFHLYRDFKDKSDAEIIAYCKEQAQLLRKRAASLKVVEIEER